MTGRDWRVHLGPVAAVLWGAALLLYALPANAEQGINLTGGLTVTWPQLLFAGAIGAFAGRVNARLDSIEKLLEKKQDKK